MCAATCLLAIGCSVFVAGCLLFDVVFACWSLLVVLCLVFRCPLSAVCRWLLLVVWYLVYVVCCVLFDVCCSLFVVGCPSFLVCCLRCALYWLLYVVVLLRFLKEIVLVYCALSVLGCLLHVVNVSCLLYSAWSFLVEAC